MKKTLLTLSAFALSTLSFAQVDTLTAHFTGNPTYYIVDAVAPTDSGFVAGTNAFGDLTKMQLFDATYGVTSGGFITGVLLGVPVKVDNGGSYQVAIWAHNDATPTTPAAPSPVPLGAVTVTLAATDTATAAYNVANGTVIYNVSATFTPPIPIPAGNKFWAGIVLPTGTSQMTLLATNATTNPFLAASTHTGEFQAGGAFHTFNEPGGADWNLNAALGIYPVVNFTAGINENVITASVYPNPASDVLNIKSTEEIEAVVISTMDGKVVAEGTSSSVNVSELNAGIYLYTATTVSGKVARGNFAKN